MSGPWEAYQTPAPAAPEGPWTAYQAASKAAEAPAGPYIGSPNFRLSTILRHAFDMAKGGATLPGDVHAGRVDPLSDEAIGRAADLAMFATPTVPKVIRGASSPAAPAVAAPPRAEVAAAAENVGMDIPRVALMPSWVQKVGAGISDLPVLGAPLQRSAEKVLGQAEGRVAETAAELGAASREGAGAGVQAGVQRFKAESIPQIEREAYAPVNAALKPEGYTPKFPASETAAALGEIQTRLERSGGTLGGEAARVARMLEQGRVDFQALQDARSALGAQMRDKLNRQGYDDWADARLYGALSRDMEGAAKAVGGDDLAGALRSANAQTREAWEQFKTVAPLGRETTSPNAVFEQVFGLAMDKRGDINKLATLRKTLGPDEWGNVAATAIERMGKNNSDQFSMQFFLSNYDKMNPSARTLLFGEARKSIDDLATSFRALQGIERFKSKSQSANPLAVAATFVAGGGAFTEPFTTATALLGSYAGARWLAKPATAEAMARWARNYEILVRRPSEGLAKSAVASAKRFGAVSAAELGMPAAANDLAAPLLDATRQIMLQRAARGGDQSGPAVQQNEGEDR